MAVSENDTSDCNSDSSPDSMTSKERKERPFTKAVIRRLPPSMTKDIFLEQVSPLPDYDYMYFVRADMSLGENAFSRAYINFKNNSDIFIFKEKFDNYVFLDAKGSEYTAVVEFAPFSRIPRKRTKIRVDPKNGSIETDPLYLEFLDSLKEVENNENEEKPEYCFQPATEEEKQKNINTPLLEFIKQRRIDRQKIREEKREERKRKELERKRYKDEERRRRSDRRPESSYHQGKTISNSKNIQILNSTKDANQDEKKDDPVPKKERKYDDVKYEKPYEKYKDDKKYSYQKSKEYKKDDSKKSPTKIRERTYEKSGVKSKYDAKRKDDSYRGSKKVDYNKDAIEDEKIEKKVKKYSERREERRNEIKKMETLKSDDKRKEFDKEDSREDKEIGKGDEKHDSDERNNGDEHGKLKENDPRSQRRIRNKDRPSLAIYQPGMGLGRNRNKGESNNDTKTENSS